MKNIKDTFFSMAKKLFKPNNFMFWIGISLVSNGFFFYYNLENLNIPKDKLYTIEGDAPQYVYSAENVVQGKDFTFFKTDSKEYIFKSNLSTDYDRGIYYAFRTPGFAFIYIPLRLVFSFNTTLILILLIQIILSAIAKYLLARLGFLIFKRKAVFYFFIVTANLTGYIVFYNNFLFTESLALSFLIFSIYSFYIFRNNKNNIFLLLSGLSFTETIFLRPFMAPLLGLFILIIFLDFRAERKKIINLIIILLLPLFIIDGAWTLRNYYKTSRFIPLASTQVEKDFNHKVISEGFDLAANCGETIEWWVKDSPMNWLRDSSNTKNPQNIYPDYLFQTIAIADTLCLAKKNYLLSLDTNICLNERIAYEINAGTKIKNISNNFRNDQPFKYYVLSRVKLVNYFINQKINKPLISIKYPLNVLGVFFESLICYFTFFLGTISILLLVFFKRQKNRFLILFNPLFIILLFPIVFQFAEYRELYMAFPFMLLSGISMMIVPQYKFKWLINSLILFCLIVFSAFYTYNHINW